MTPPMLLLKSRRVVPTRLLASGFQLHYPEAEAAVAAIVQSKARSAPRR